MNEQLETFGSVPAQRAGASDETLASNGDCEYNNATTPTRCRVVGVDFLQETLHAALENRIQTREGVVDVTNVTLCGKRICGNGTLIHVDMFGSSDYLLCRKCAAQLMLHRHPLRKWIERKRLDQAALSRMTEDGDGGT